MMDAQLTTWTLFNGADKHHRYPDIASRLPFSEVHRYHYSEHSDALVGGRGGSGRERIGATASAARCTSSAVPRAMVATFCSAAGFIAGMTLDAVESTGPSAVDIDLVVLD